MLLSTPLTCQTQAVFDRWFFFDLRNNAGIAMARFIPEDRRKYDPQFNKAKSIGEYGERVAEKFLRRQKYQILVRNYTSDWGEIDLVCRHENTLVFVEVKTRAANAEVRPALAVDSSKRRRIIRTARAYLREIHNPPITTRFDIVEVLLAIGEPPSCTLLRSAFGLEP
jgi:putative endonuclease